MENLDDYKFSKEHEWLLEDNGIATLGLSQFAQESLGDIVYVELPEVGTIVEKGDTIGSLESVKSVSDLYSPIDGEIVEVNEALEDQPDLINSSPYDGGWVLKIKINPADMQSDDLMSSDAYDAFVKDSSI